MIRVPLHGTNDRWNIRWKERLVCLAQLLFEMLHPPRDTNLLDYFYAVVNMGSTILLVDSRMFPFDLDHHDWVDPIEMVSAQLKLLWKLIVLK